MFITKKRFQKHLENTHGADPVFSFPCPLSFRNTETTRKEQDSKILGLRTDIQLIMECLNVIKVTYPPWARLMKIKKVTKKEK